MEIVKNYYSINFYTNHQYDIDIQEKNNFDIIKTIDNLNKKIDKNYIIEDNINNKYHMKYIKYKNKYIKLKSRY